MPLARRLIVSRTSIQGGSERDPGALGIAGLAGALAAAALGIVTAVLLAHENTSWPSPWHHDDFNNLGHATMAVRWGTVRPVAFTFWSTLGRLGPDALYLALFCLVAAHAALCAAWTAEVLGAPRRRRTVAAVAFATAGVLMLFEWSPWFLRYTGHITNALSAALGMAAALLALRLGSLAPGGIAGMLLLCTLSAFAKEDFVLLPMLSLAFVARLAHESGERRLQRRAISLIGLVAAIAASALAYAVLVGSPFVFGAGTYKAKLTLTSLAETTSWYVLCTRYARNLLVGLVIATAASLALRLARPLSWSVVWLAVAALIAPYLPIGEHRYEIYAFNWLPLMLAALLSTVATAMARGSRPVRVLAAVAGIVAVLNLNDVAWKERGEQAGYIAAAETWTRLAMERAAALLAARPEAGVVAVSGTDRAVFGPWFANTGIHLNRTLGREVRWIVLQDPGSFSREVLLRYWSRDFGRVLFVDESCRDVLLARGIPILDVGPEGPPRPAGSPTAEAAAAGGAATTLPDPSECGLAASSDGRGIAG